MHFLTAAQVESLADAIAPPHGVLIRFAAYTGLRPCEYVALKVGHLDLLRGTVRVAEAALEVADRLEPAIAAPNEALAQLDPAGHPELLPEELRLYDLQHTAASLMTRQGGQRQGGPEAARPRHGRHHPGHLRAPVPRRAGGAGGPPGDARAETLASLAPTSADQRSCPYGESAGQ